MIGIKTDVLQGNVWGGWVIVSFQLHAEGIRVLLPYLPWDQLTRPTEQQHVAELIQQVTIVVQSI